MRNISAAMLGLVLLLLAEEVAVAAEAKPIGSPQDNLQISGVYPHLAAFNGHGECGIGAVVPWAERLWWITYPPHYRHGSDDKLYSIDESLALKIHPESVGGTHAARMIHGPSKQLLIGPYAIDADGNVRAMDVKKIPGRYTAWATHLTDPDNKAYLFDMEGPLWEIDVHSLAGRRLFLKPVPGWHGKGAYTAQRRLVISNNGENRPGNPSDVPGEWEAPIEKWSRGEEDAGVLAQYDGSDWEILKRRQFVDITGPGGIRGSRSPDDPLWAMGWDKRSVLLEVLDEGQWTTYRLPKASHAMDPRHGWYTEWPRIRQVAEGRALMCMHGMFFDFPLSFSSSSAHGIRPICSHLRYVPDFCTWNDQLVIASDDTSIMQNPMAGQSHSNLWFGSIDDLHSWGPGYAFGGPWLTDAVKANEPSDPYLFAGFRGRVLHLTADGGQQVDVTVEIDADGNGDWNVLEKLTIPASGYTHHVFADDTPGEWIRFRSAQEATLSAYLHYYAVAERNHPRDEGLFAGLRSNDDPGQKIAIRPAKHNRNLQVIFQDAMSEKRLGDDHVGSYHVGNYVEFDQRLQPSVIDDQARAAEAHQLLQFKPMVEYDAASAIITGYDMRRYRLPIVPGTKPIGRDVREVQSERTLAHIGNLFYEAPRGPHHKGEIDFRRMRPVAAHRFAIHDFCTWRGLLVLAGARAESTGDGHVIVLPENRTGNEKPALWFGMVDDLWKLGKPVGVGGPWKKTLVSAGAASDPYIMTGFDRKSLEISHDANVNVEFRIEVDYSNRDHWQTFGTLNVAAGETKQFVFPDGYSAHWVRLVPSRDCEATALFRYE